MKKLLIFDYDKTLAEPAEKPSEEMQRELARLLETNYIAVMSGGRSRKDLEVLLADDLPVKSKDALRNLYLCPVYGNKIYQWDNGYKLIAKSMEMSEEDKQYIMSRLKDIKWEEFGLPVIELDQIHYRDTSVSVVCLGKDIPKEIRESWDPDKVKR